MLGAIHEDEIGGATDLNEPAVECAYARRIAGRKAEGDFRGNVAERSEQCDHPQDAERLNARARRGVGAKDDAVQFAALLGCAQSEQRRAFVAVVHEFETAFAALAQANDLIVGERRVTAIDVADHVGVRLEHDVLVDEPGARDGRTAGMNRAVDAVFARPSDHLARSRPIFDAAEPDLTEEADAGGGKLLEIMLLHPRLDHRRARVHLHTAGAKVRKAALRCNRHRLKSDDVARPTGRVNFARGHHRGDAAMQARIDPVELALPRGPIARDRMDVAVDQARRYCDAMSIYRRRSARKVEVGGAPDCSDAAVDSEDRLLVEVLAN